MKEIKKNIKGVFQEERKKIKRNYKKAYDNLKKELERLYQRYERDSKIPVEELRRYKRFDRFDALTTKILIEMYRQNKRMIGKDLKDLTNVSIRQSLKVGEGIVTVKKKIDPTRIINREIGGKIWEDRIKHHGNNFVYDLHGIIHHGIEQGNTYTEVSKEIKKRFGKDLNNTLTIARTETHRVVEDSKNEVFEAINEELKDSTHKVIKVWHTMQDEGVRDSHSPMEGRTVDYEESFVLPSGVTTDYPGESGVPSEDINCRCYVTYKIVPKE